MIALTPRLWRIILYKRSIRGDLAARHDYPQQAKVSFDTLQSCGSFDIELGALTMRVLMGWGCQPISSARSLTNRGVITFRRGNWHAGRRSLRVMLDRPLKAVLIAAIRPRISI